LRLPTLYFPARAPGFAFPRTADLQPTTSSRACVKLRALQPIQPLMIQPRCRIAASLTPGTGKGLDEPLARGGMIVAAGRRTQTIQVNTIVATLADCAIGHALLVRGHA
jgi:hypothetical protein